MPATSYKLQATSYRGFTLIEAVVSIFIFSVVMLSVSKIFISAFQEYSYAKTVERDLEAAQFAMNTMAKELRTSSIVGANSTFLKFYDHSQGTCFAYWKVGSQLLMDKYQPDSSLSLSAKLDDCKNHTFSSTNSSTKQIAGGINFGRFQAIASDSTTSPKVVGKVTVSLTIGEGAIHQARIQTTVSLRDYGNVGF